MNANTTGRRAAVSLPPEPVPPGRLARIAAWIAPTPPLPRIERLSAAPPLPMAERRQIAAQRAAQLAGRERARGLVSRQLVRDESGRMVVREIHAAPAEVDR